MKEVLFLSFLYFLMVNLSMLLEGLIFKYFLNFML